MSVLACCTALKAPITNNGDGLHHDHHRSRHLHPLRVLGESKETKTLVNETMERSESDRLVDGMNFGELCNDFECLSSPAVESTARQLVRDILELREGNSALGSYSISVKYKDPVRTFTGREKYRRLLWATSALENPSVSSLIVAGFVTRVNLGDEYLNIYLFTCNRIFGPHCI